MPAGGVKHVGIRYFISAGGAQSVRFNWKTVGKIGSQGLASIDYWDGSKVPQPIPTKHVKFDTEQSLVKVLPLVVDLLKGELDMAGYYMNESVSLQHIPMIIDFAATYELNEASMSAGDVSKTLHAVVVAWQQGISKNDQYKTGGSKKYGAGWNKINDTIISLYPAILKKEGNKNVVDQMVAAKIDQKKVLAALGGDADVVSYSTAGGTKEEIEVEGTSEADIERLSYEEQLESLKTAMKLLM